MNHAADMLAFVNGLALAWRDWMLPMSLQLLVLVAVIYLIDRVFGRRAWPQFLAALWLLVFLKLVLPPTLSSPTSLANLIAVDPTALVQSGAEPTAAKSTQLALPAGGTHVATAGTIDTVNALTQTCFGVWLVGFIALMLRGAHKSWKLRIALAATESRCPIPDRLSRRFEELRTRLGMKKSPRIILTSSPMGPAVFGVLRPTIVLPQLLLNCTSTRELDHILLHELSHVRRRDALIDLLCRLLTVAYWFHPAVWLARRRLATIRELCCDEAVAESLAEQANEYRRTLLMLSRPMWAPAGIPFVPRRSQLVERLERLSQPRRVGNARRRALALATVTVLVACVLPMTPAAGADEQPSAALPDQLVDKAPDEVDASSSDKDFAAKIAALPIADDDELQPVSFQTPPLDELEGCMQLRFAVMAEMARQAQATSVE